MDLNRETLKNLSPGVRRIVVLLNKEGFPTTDSGDGSNHAKGMECAPPYPMIAIKCDKKNVITETDRLYSLIKEHCALDALVDIQTSYSPVDKLCLILIFNLTDANLIGKEV